MTIGKRPTNLAPPDASYTEWEVTVESLEWLVESDAEFELIAYFGDDDLPNDVRVRFPELQPTGTRGVGGRLQIYIVPLLDGSNEVRIR